MPGASRPRPHIPGSSCHLSPAQLCPSCGAGGSPLVSLGADVNSLCFPSLTGSQGRTNCCVGAAGAATCAFVPRCLHVSSSSSLLPAHLPMLKRAGGHSYPTPVTPCSCGWGITVSSALLQPGWAGKDACGPCQCHGGRTPTPPFALHPLFLPFPIPALTSGSKVGVPEQFQQQQHETSPSCPHCCAIPSLPSATASVSLPGSRSEHGPGFGSALHRVHMEELPQSPGSSPLPQTPGSLLTALQLGSGLRHWLGEGFFPGCNFSLLHTVCFEQCLEASHPRLTAGAGECAGCQPREAPAPDPSLLGEITAN